MITAFLLLFRCSRNLSSNKIFLLNLIGPIIIWHVSHFQECSFVLKGQWWETLQLLYWLYLWCYANLRFTRQCQSDQSRWMVLENFVICQHKLIIKASVVIPYTAAYCYSHLLGWSANFVTLTLHPALYRASIRFWWWWGGIGRITIWRQIIIKPARSVGFWQIK